MKKSILFFIVILCALSFFTLNGESKNVKSLLNPESNFYQLGHIHFRLKAKGCNTCEYRSNRTRIWYSFFPADESPETKPLFVFTNGGPGCSTSTNLFAMNTAPYTLDRARVEAGKVYKENDSSWSKIGNLLYIDAPNTGFSYMLSKVAGWRKLSIMLEFLAGDNYNPFIDSDQVIRVVLHFLEKHPEIQKNKVVFIGESYSGVRVTTILNQLLFYKEYSDGNKVFRDEKLGEVIKRHLDKAMPVVKKTYSPKEVASQFSHQILIQPQIAGKYQEDAQDEMYAKPDSIINNLKPFSANNVNSKLQNRDYMWFRQRYGSSEAAMLYLNLIERDQYNYKKYWLWTDNNEEFTIKALMDVNDLSTITKCDVTKIKYLQPKERKYALRFFINKNDAKWIKNPLVEKIIKYLKPVVSVWIENIQHNLVHPIPSMYKNKVDCMDEKLGKLSDYDSYLVPTNLFSYLGFMIGSGLYKGGIHDVFEINADGSTRYGRMFLENLTVVDTFMTDAQLDLCIYSPTLPAEFDSNKGRYTDVVKEVISRRGNKELDGEFVIYYKAGSIKGIKEVPAFRTVTWPHYEYSGHSVSATEPEKLLKDVDDWLSGNKKVKSL